MALAGDLEIIVAVVAQLGRAAGRAGNEGRNGRRQVALALLAAEATAHAPDLDGHGIERHVEHMGDGVLDLGRVLGGRVDRDLVALAGNGERDLALEVEVLLPTHAHAAFEPVGRGGNGCIWITATEAVGQGQEGARVHGLVHGEDGGLLGIGDIREPSGPACGLARRCGDSEQRLAQMLDAAGREYRIVVVTATGAHVVATRNIGGGEHGYDARCGSHHREVERGDLGVRSLAHAERDMECARRLGDVVGVEGRARDVPDRAVVGDRVGNAADDAGLGAIPHGAPFDGRRRCWRRRGDRRSPAFQHGHRARGLC